MWLTMPKDANGDVERLKCWELLLADDELANCYGFDGYLYAGAADTARGRAYVKGSSPIHHMPQPFNELPLFCDLAPRFALFAFFFGLLSLPLPSVFLSRSHIIFMCSLFWADLSLLKDTGGDEGGVCARRVQERADRRMEVFEAL
jgi:hypothetical protein